MILVEGWYEQNFKHFCWSWAENSYESNNPSIFGSRYLPFQAVDRCKHDFLSVRPSVCTTRKSVFYCLITLFWYCLWTITSHRSTSILSSICFFLSYCNLFLFVNSYTCSFMLFVLFEEKNMLFVNLPAIYQHYQGCWN